MRSGKWHFRLQRLPRLSRLASALALRPTRTGAAMSRSRLINQMQFDWKYLTQNVDPRVGSQLGFHGS
jgi:hypothetical protein